MLAFLLGGATVLAAVGGAASLKLAGAHAASAVGRKLISIRQERAVAEAAAGFFDPEEGEAAGQFVRFTMRDRDQEVELVLTPREIEELSNDYLSHYAPGILQHTGDPERRERLLRMGLDRAHWG